MIGRTLTAIADSFAIFLFVLLACFVVAVATILRWEKAGRVRIKVFFARRHR